jgi:hypothetical protein
LCCDEEPNSRKTILAQSVGAEMADVEDEDQELLGTEMRSMEELDDDVPSEAPKGRGGKAGLTSCLLAPSSLLLVLAVAALAGVVLLGLAADGVVPEAGW